jgi:hypothetical protein
LAGWDGSTGGGRCGRGEALVAACGSALGAAVEIPPRARDRVTESVRSWMNGVARAMRDGGTAYREA